jgi:predicted phage tail protein
MIRQVVLHGAAGREFGRAWELDVASPAEAIRALCTLRPGIETALKEGFWRVIVGPPRLRNAIDLELLHMDAGDQPIHIVPATPPHGGDDTAMSIGKIVVGVALIAASFFTGGATGFLVASLAFSEAAAATATTAILGAGMSLLFGGVAGLLTPAMRGAPVATDQARPEDRPSFLFSGVTNNSVQGAPVPVVLGTHLAGSILVSGSINVEDIAV